MALRIISGDFRGRKLRTPRDRTTRPYTDRVRQKVFDRLGERLVEARVADVFSGVGTMGLECLSRGASSCVFFEFDDDVFQCLQENVTAISGDLPTLCWRTNVHRTSFVPQGIDIALPYDLVFFDPPYPQCDLLDAQKPLGKSLTRLSRPKATSDDCLVILRTPGKVPFTGVPGWEVDDLWEISTMNLWLLTKPDGSENDEDAAPG